MKTLTFPFCPAFPGLALIDLFDFFSWNLFLSNRTLLDWKRRQLGRRSASRPSLFKDSLLRVITKAIWKESAFRQDGYHRAAIRTTCPAIRKFNYLNCPAVREAGRIRLRRHLRNSMPIRRNSMDHPGRNLKGFRLRPSSWNLQSENRQSPGRKRSSGFRWKSLPVSVNDSLQVIEIN